MSLNTIRYNSSGAYYNGERLLTQTDASLIKTPVNTPLGLQNITTPENGEMRQDLSLLPTIAYYTFNTTAASGLLANDGTVGYWNKPSVEPRLIEKTYLELKTLRDAGELEVGEVVYKMIDFQTTNKAGMDQVNVAVIEQLHLKALDTNIFAKKVTSPVHPDDKITYDIDDDAITNDAYGEWEDNSDEGGDITFSNWTTSTVDINKEIIINDNFYFYAEDDNGDDIEYEQGQLGTDFILTNLGGGMSRITDLTGGIDFAHHDFNFGEIYGDVKVSNRAGNFIFREDTVKRIKTAFDFRGVKYARKRLDETSITTWNSTTNYNAGDLCQKYGNLYSAIGDHLNESVSGSNWLKISANIDRLWSFADGQLATQNVTLDPTIKLIPVFSYWDGSDYIFSIKNVRDVSIMSDYNLFAMESIHASVDKVSIGAWSEGNTFNSEVRNCIFPNFTEFNIAFESGNLRNMTFEGNFSRNIISGSCSSSTLGTIYSSMLGTMQESTIKGGTNIRLRNSTRSTIGGSVYNVGFGNVIGSNFGINGTNSFFAVSYYNTIGDNYKNIKQNINDFSNNTIGDLWNNFEINSSFVFNIIGSHVGNSISSIVVQSVWSGNAIKNNVFITGVSSFGTILRNSTIGNDVHSINIQYGTDSTTIGDKVHHITARGLSTTDIKYGCHHFNFSGGLYNNIFERYTYNLTCTGVGAFVQNHVLTGADNINFGSNSWFVHRTYDCTIYRRFDGVNRLSYMNNSDILTVVDPTATTA